MDPKQINHRKTLSRNSVRIPTPKVYHKSSDLAQAQSALCIVILLLAISILVNMILFIRIDQLQSKLNQKDEINVIDTGSVLEHNKQTDRPDIDKEPPYETIPICSTTSTFKSWMDYRAITSTSSRQWKLQQTAITDESGFRKIDDYYMVAMAKMYGPVGTKYLISFSGGSMIYAIMSDIKSGTTCAHPDSSMLEFIVNRDHLISSVKRSGNVNKLFEGTIIEIRVVQEVGK